ADTRRENSESSPLPTILSYNGSAPAGSDEENPSRLKNPTATCRALATPHPLYERPSKTSQMDTRSSHPRSGPRRQPLFYSTPLQAACPLPASARRPHSHR